MTRVLVLAILLLGASVVSVSGDDRVSAKAGRRHVHVWVHWEAWLDWGWRPLPNTRLYVCDVPGCNKARIEVVG